MLVETGRFRKGVSFCCVELGYGCFSVHLDTRIVFRGLRVLGWLYKAVALVFFAKRIEKSAFVFGCPS